MKSNRQISLQEPCQEDWNAMPLSGKGRSCDTCQKVVLDYSKMSDSEIIYLLKTDSSACGNFRTDQMNRPLLVSERNLFPTFNLHAIALGLGVLIAAPGYAAQQSSGLEHLDLIEVVQGTSVLPLLDQGAKDSLFTFKLVHAYSHQPVAKARVEFIDIRGNVSEVVYANEQGILVYQKKMFEERQIVEIRFIPKSGKLMRETIEWVQTSEEETTITLRPKAKKLKRRHSRTYMRGAF